MLAVSYNALSDRLNEYCDRVADDAETVIITRDNDKSIVMMGLDTYNNLLENFYIMSNAVNYRHILKGVQQIEAGQTTAKTIDDLENMANE